MSSVKLSSLNILPPAPPARSLSPTRIKRNFKLQNIDTKRFSPSLSNTITSNTEKNSIEYNNNLLFNLYGDFKNYLPNLTNSSKIDTQLYILIGLFLNQFINKWYINLTNDKSFTEEIIKIVSVLIHNLCDRIGKLNLTKTSDKLVIVLNNHLTNYRACSSKKSTILNYDNLIKSFKNLSNHIIVNEDDETMYFKVLVHKILSYSFDDFSLQNSKLSNNFIVEVMGDLVLKNCFDKMSEDYFWWELITNISNSLINEDKVVSTRKPLKQKIHSYMKQISKLIVYTSNAQSINVDNEADNFNLINHSIFGFLSDLLSISIKRPMLYGLIASIKPLYGDKINQLGLNFISHLFKTRLTSETISGFFFRIRQFLFPDDIEMGKGRVPPKEEERIKIRLTAKEKSIALIKQSPLLVTFLFEDENVLNNEIDAFLDAFKHKEINKLLVINILDSLVGELYPELSK